MFNTRVSEYLFLHLYLSEVQIKNGMYGTSNT